MGGATFDSAASSFWTAGASVARRRFGSFGAEFRHSQSAVAAALCRRTPKGSRVAYPADASLIQSIAMLGLLGKLRRHRLHVPISKRDVALAAVTLGQSVERPIPKRNCKCILSRVGMQECIKLRFSHLIKHPLFGKDDFMGRPFDRRGFEKVVWNVMGSERGHSLLPIKFGRLNRLARGCYLQSVIEKVGLITQSQVWRI